MKNPQARIRETGSFVAGLLIGLSIVVPVFAMMATDASAGQTLWVFGAPIILVLGLALQVVVTPAPRNWYPTDPEGTFLPKSGS